MSTDQAKLVRYIRDMGREMAKMANNASLDLLAYLLSLVVLEADSLTPNWRRLPRILLCKIERQRQPIYLNSDAVAQLPRFFARLSGWDCHE